MISEIAQFLNKARKKERIRENETGIIISMSGKGDITLLRMVAKGIRGIIETELKEAQEWCQKRICYPGLYTQTF